MPRKRLPTEIETLILTESHRRCCICYALKGDDSEKRGQIAHLDQDPSNNDSSNLAFICFDHHDQYDSQTSQSKNLTISEVKQYKLKLIEYFKREAGLKQSAVEVSSSAAHKQTAPQVDPTPPRFGYSSSTHFFLINLPAPFRAYEHLRGLSQMRQLNAFRRFSVAPLYFLKVIIGLVLFGGSAVAVLKLRASKSSTQRLFL